MPTPDIVSRLRSIPTARIAWTVGLILLILGGLVGVGEGQFATSSPPPPQVGPSGLLLYPATAEQIDALSTGLPPRVEIEEAYAIRSQDHERVWYVGGRLDVSASVNPVGVWLVTGSRSHPGLIYSVDRAARSRSIWPDARKSRTSVSSADPEAVALVSLLESRP